MQKITQPETLVIEDEDVYEPGSIDELISFLKRNFNTMNEQSVVLRKKAIQNIYERLENEKPKLSNAVSQQLLMRFHKAILQAFSDKAEKCREFAIKILKELITRCDEMTPFLPYILSVLTERVNCLDLEGIQNLPEVMRPPPGQKPKRMIKLIEESEEIRLELCRFVYDLVCCAQNQEFYDFLDDTCNVLRTLAMDPSSDVQLQACKTISQFCKNNTEILLHFTEMLGRSILLPLISKKSRVRIAALDALGSILYCGIWKYNAFVFENLIGFRDPNSVPIKAFYESMHNINYFATLAEDSKPRVRDAFLRCCGDWALRLADRYDHHPRLIPYIVSSLFDEVEEIRETAFEILEEVGQMEEREKEKELRETKQFAIDAEWTLGGRLSNLPLPRPFKRRPCLGARLLVRSHVRKYWKAMYNEIRDTSITNRLKTSNLFVMNTVYSEDYLTQFLDQMVKNLIWHVVPPSNGPKENELVARNICTVFELIGRYCPWTTYLPFVTSGVKGEFSQNDDYTRAAIQALACLAKGALEASPPDEGLSERKMLLETLVHQLMKQCSREQLLEVFAKHAPVLLRLIHISIYLAYLDKTYILNSPYSSQTTADLDTKLLSSPLIELATEVLSACVEREKIQSQLANELSAESSRQQIHFSHHTWRCVIGQIIYNIYASKRRDSKLLKSLFDVVQLAVLENNNPEISDFVSKFSLLLQFRLENEVQESATTNSAEQVLIYANINSLCGIAAKFYAATELKINDKIVANFISLVQEFGERLYAKSMSAWLRALAAQNELAGVAKIFWAIPELFAKYFRKKKSAETLGIIHVMQLLTENLKEEIVGKCQLLKVIERTKVQKKITQIPSQSVNAVADTPDTTKKREEQQDMQSQATFEAEQQSQQELQIDSNGQSTEKDQNQKEPNQKEKKTIEETEYTQEEVFVMPKVFSFVMRRIEQLGDQPNQKVVETIFKTMLNLTALIPTIENNYYEGEEEVIEDYPNFLGKLLKYAVDERDLEMREKFLRILRILGKKTPFNFRIEHEVAQKHRQHSRIELIRKLMDLPPLPF